MFEPTARPRVDHPWSAGGLKGGIVGHSFELLPIEERIQQYREMADATFLKAQRAADPEVRTQYFNLATRWHALAQELEGGNPDPERFPKEQQPAAGSRPT